MFGRLVQRLKASLQDKQLAVALLSCPSLYSTLKAIHDNGELSTLYPRRLSLICLLPVHLFEYDRRFAAYGEDFVHYDYKFGLESNYLAEHRGRYDLIISDPPFLSQECVENMAAIIQRLQKPSPDTRIVFCSGAVVEEWVCGLLPLRKCHFQPQHHRNLGNEFATYANFDLDHYIREC